MDPVSLGSCLLVCKIILVVTQIAILVVNAAFRFYS